MLAMFVVGPIELAIIAAVVVGVVLAISSIG
jgi:hypothetical protein